ncbi:MAG: 2-amino-4-hydroxy-6-hydroxymethyldihydropteridine diphosphokinase [Thermaurantimonas sp.]|uniref:2-amino-4-hydroxy-6- hydroxymethyldihydropteridine diphosphokinase n=1 Tax=Thermaurantimonas sp. TaxID=2681568 RepID=UPI00391CF0E9
MKQDKKYILLLGGNVGDVKKTFAFAKSLLLKQGIEILQESSLYATEPWKMDGAEFLNQAIEVKTPLRANLLMSTLLEIEYQCGRDRTHIGKYTSRTLDIDIVHAFDLIENSEIVQIPHPRMHLRKFTLIPVSELTPHWQHPFLKKSCLELLKECSDTSQVIKVA